MMAPVNSTDRCLVTLSEGLETYEVEDFLADILDTEFNTIADDGSLSVVSNGNINSSPELFWC